MQILFDDVIRQAAPSLVVGVIEADIINTHTSEALWDELQAEAEATRGRYADISQVNKRPEIAATRAAYKALGKDPNRYRPSSEALTRRCLRGLELYRINAAVDIINLISLRSGHSIGGFDIDKIQGDTLRLGRGAQDEPFEGIGRGPLNIDGLPLYRDAVGGIGTPTSDHERTKLTLPTRRLLICINMYDSSVAPQTWLDLSRELLERYLQATNITTRILPVTPAC